MGLKVAPPTAAGCAGCREGQRWQSPEMPQLPGARAGRRGSREVSRTARVTKRSNMGGTSSTSAIFRSKEDCDASSPPQDPAPMQALLAQQTALISTMTQQMTQQMKDLNARVEAAEEASATASRPGRGIPSKRGRGVHGGMGVPQVKLPFTEEQVHAGAGGAVNDFVLAVWLEELDTQKVKAVMTTHKVDKAPVPFDHAMCLADANIAQHEWMHAETDRCLKTGAWMHAREGGHVSRVFHQLRSPRR
eukprot:gene15379-biopygen15836